MKILTTSGPYPSMVSPFGKSFSNGMLWYVTTDTTTYCIYNPIQQDRYIIRGTWPIIERNSLQELLDYIETQERIRTL